jgi:hypothetical protein
LAAAAAGILLFSFFMLGSGVGNRDIAHKTQPQLAYAPPPQTEEPLATLPVAHVLQKPGFE